MRRSRRRPTQDLSPELAVADRDAIGQADDREQMRARSRGCRPDHRVVVALRYYRDLTIDEIADRLAISPGTVSSASTTRSETFAA